MEPIFSHLLIDYDSREQWGARWLEVPVLLSHIYGKGQRGSTSLYKGDTISLK
jgi:hypothetical protein